MLRAPPVTKSIRRVLDKLDSFSQMGLAKARLLKRVVPGAILIKPCWLPSGVSYLIVCARSFLMSHDYWNSSSHPHLRNRRTSVEGSCWGRAVFSSLEK